MVNMHGEYEQKQLREVETWEVAPPSHLARAVGFLSAPLSWVAKQMIPEEVMSKALTSALEAAGAISGSEDLLQDAGKLGVEANSIADLEDVSLHISDALSASVLSWAKGIAAAEGALTGMAGLPGLALDVPALIILAIRTIRKIGFCYGFDTNKLHERPFLLQVLSAGAANTMEEKVRALIAAARISQEIALSDENTPMEAPLDTVDQEVLGKEAFAAAVRNLAKQLCANLAKRKAAQAIPIVGGGIGAALNVVFIGDVSEAALRLFQKRRLEGKFHMGGNGAVIKR